MRITNSRRETAGGAKPSSRTTVRVAHAIVSRVGEGSSRVDTQEFQRPEITCLSNTRRNIYVQAVEQQADEEKPPSNQRPDTMETEQAKENMH